MKKIGVLGGTFNPPHYGHLLIANEVLHAFQLDEIWFMPNQEPPHKQKALDVSNDDRIEMLNRALETNPDFKLITTELERKGASYTYDTIKILKGRYPEHKFYFIIGADMIEYLPKWYKIEQLLELIEFIGVDRPAYTTKSDFDIHYVQTPMMEVSSSMIRDRVSEGNPIRYLLPEEVRNYIEEKGLYGTQ
ncbi:nicotinate-nucleotide adenylyltransferase [Mesobacillus harenae]|uniref:nicotinate-nucleotide adenylyltransferase n=1 Tax=Mesobacillus harenae TaxID=2213203 RepID=UPI00158102AE